MHKPETPETRTKKEIFHAFYSWSREIMSTEYLMGSEFYETLSASLPEGYKPGDSIPAQVILRIIQEHNEPIDAAIRKMFGSNVFHYEAMSHTDREELKRCVIRPYFRDVSSRPKYVKLSDSPEIMESIATTLSNKYPHDSDFFKAVEIHQRGGLPGGGFTELIKRAIERSIWGHDGGHELNRLWRKEATAGNLQSEILARYLQLIEKQPKQTSWRERVGELFGGSRS